MKPILDIIHSGWDAYSRDIPSNSALGIVGAALSASSDMEGDLDRLVHSMAGIGGLAVVVLSIMNLWLSFRKRKQDLDKEP
jgi:hypothetical protein